MVLKMKNKKGFTLIELLAVIVVLGIIMVIAIMAVSGVIRNSKMNSFKSSAMLVAKQVREYLLSTGDSSNTIDCLTNDYGLNPNNYEICKANIFYEGEKSNISVELVGKGSFQGLTIVEATMDSGTVVEEGPNSQRLKPILIASKIGDVAYGTPPATGGLYQWGTKYIYRGGVTITNSSGTGNLDNDQYASDSYNITTDINNYVKVPWESGGSCTNNYSDNPCWRIISVNSDGSITIVRDRSIPTNQAFDNTPNLDHTTQPNTYGYNDLLTNAYRGNSLMYTRVYGATGYQNTAPFKNYYYLLQPIDVCLNKVNNYVGINLSSYGSSTVVKDTCDLAGRTGTFSAVNPLRNQYVRLPYLEEYLNAGLQSNCTTDYQYQCRGRNFMYNKSYYWSLNGYASYSWLVRTVHANGYASNNDAMDSRGVRPVVNLKSSIMITGGTGSVSEPYIIKQ